MAGSVALTFTDTSKAMAIPETNFNPPFNITRASDLVLTAQDRPASHDFYTEVLGLLATKTLTRSSCVESRSAATQPYAEEDHCRDDQPQGIGRPTRFSSPASPKVAAQDLRFGAESGWMEADGLHHLCGFLADHNENRGAGKTRRVF